MWRWRRDNTIASRYKEVDFSLMGEDDAECIEEVDTFKYLVRMLERSDNDRLAVLWNFGKARWI